MADGFHDPFSLRPSVIPQSQTIKYRSGLTPSEDQDLSPFDSSPTPPDSDVDRCAASLGQGNGRWSKYGNHDALETLPTGAWEQGEAVEVDAAPHLWDGEGLSFEGQEDTSVIEDTELSWSKGLTVELPQSTLVQPRSLFEGFVAPCTETVESDAVTKLLEIVKLRPNSHDEEHIEFDLHHFAIYSDSEIYPDELRPLQHLATKASADRFYFDGILSCGETRFFLRKVPFRELPVGNYGYSEHTVGDQIWIRSEFNEKRDIFYKLGSPSVEYARFYKPYLWIADLAKHVIDFCDHLEDEGRRAVLQDFKSRFSIWMLRKHLKSSLFEQWYDANRGPDFRGAIVANVEYIWKEAHGVKPKITSWHRVWKEIKTFDQYKPNLTPLIPCSRGDLDDDEEEDDGSPQRNVSKPKRVGQVPRTIVTPYIHVLFSDMNFGPVLKPVKLSSGTEEKRSSFIRSTHPTARSNSNDVKRHNGDRGAFIASIQVGDVISTRPDDDSTDTQWKRETSKHRRGEHLWFGLVQKVHQSVRDRRSFDVIWLYQPMDTPCGRMKYPFRNELFLSDNCTCHHDAARVQADQILSTHEVEWFGNPSTSAEFFVRQTYVADGSRWITLERGHMACGEQRFVQAPMDPYQVGDAVLVETKPKALLLETFIVEAFFDEGKKKFARLRRLVPRRDVDEQATSSPSNELVYSERLVEVISKRIVRRCLVRAFRLDEKITTPYDRHGTGDAFFITHQEIEAEEGGFAYVPLQPHHLEMLRQGFDPSRTPRSQKLQGLDLFCGGGNFGRGLEDGDGIEMRWANDISNEAIHTYMANCRPGGCTPFLGSVDDLLLRAVRGDKVAPRPGDVQFISAGSPCPGFSLLTQDKTTDSQSKNRSLIASFASFIDLYRPHYALLENVAQMVNSRSPESCVFSQLVCAIVGLGYQFQVMQIDAWSFGAPQRRSRVFLCFTAPGFRTPKVPRPSHSHPTDMPLHRLGKTSCGLPFDRRELVSTPFKFVSASDSVRDLPDIQDAKADYCVGFPDHRLARGYTAPTRKQLRIIPTQPFGMNFSKAWHGRTPNLPPVMSMVDRHLFPPAQVNGKANGRVDKPSKGWGRIHPHGLFNTIATSCQPTDARMGYTNHWQQHRPISVLEARRAQGFLDSEVILGSSNNQFKIIGNSVARQAALALGLAIREAWFGTLLDEEPIPQTEKSTWVEVLGHAEWE